MEKIKNFLKPDPKSFVSSIYANVGCWIFTVGCPSVFGILFTLDPLELKTKMSQAIVFFLYFLTGLGGALLLYVTWRGLQFAWKRARKDKHEPPIKPLPLPIAPIVTSYEDIKTRKIGIRIENPNDSNLMHPAVILVKLIYLKPNGKTEYIIFSENNCTFRSGTYSHGNEHIEPYEPANVPIVRAGDTKIQFQLGELLERDYSYDPDTNTPYGIGESDYEIELSVIGTVHGHRVETPFKRTAYFHKSQVGYKVASWRQ